MSAPPLESSFFYRMATSLNKAWADWFTALGATQSGLGTMATQNANSVAIAGGTISGTTITFSTGTFTPTLVSSGGGAPTYSAQVGTYTVIGNRVAFNVYVLLAAYGSLAAGTLSIAGLPFTSDATANNRNVCFVLADSLDATAATSVVAQISTGASAILLYRYAAGSLTALSKAATSSTALFRVSGIYQV